MKDYFNHLNEVPKSVKLILEDLEKDFLEYSDLANITTELNKLGWTMDYGLDASPFDLQPLKYYSILQLVDKSTIIDANWYPYLMSSKGGKQVLKAMKKVSSLSSYQLILELHEGWKIDDFIKYYI